jgi:hypothetical protein
MTTIPDPPALERHYDDGEVSFDGRLDAGGDVQVTVRGHGNLPGARAMIAFLDEVASHLGGGRSARIHYDISRVHGAPLRAQILFAKWFVSHRRVVSRVAIVGAGPVERRVAAIASAGFGNLRFFERDAEARAWLRADAA